MREKIIAAIIAVLAMIPTAVITVSVITNDGWWTYGVLLFGLAAFLFLYTQTPIFVKAFLVFLFLSCFASRAPYISFTCFMMMTGCAYFYNECLKVKNIDTILRVVQGLFWITAVMVGMQTLGHDKLLNFGREHATYVSTLGNPMMAGTFIVCLAPFLIMKSRAYFIPLFIIALMLKSSGTILSLAIGAVICLLVALKGNKAAQAWIIVVAIAVLTAMAIKQHDVFQFMNQDRWPAWKKSIQLSMEHPFMGHGLGTYKVIAPAMMTIKDAGGTADKWTYLGTTGNVLAWRQAHNFYIQALFETGFIGLSFIFMLIGLTLWWIARKKDIILLTGAVILAVNMTIHFPDRMIQTSMLLILFMALCHRKGKTWHTQH